MNNGLKTVALIPACNEESSIAKVILLARQHVDNVIVCDDGSTDMTSKIAEAVGAKVLRHPERRGKGEAFKTLYKEAMGLNPDIIVTIDGDGQHDPDDIPMLLKPIEAGESDMVIGSRYVNGGKMDAALYRRFGLGVINFLYKQVAGVHIKDTQSGFRAYSQEAVGSLIHFDSKGYGVEGEQLVLAYRNGLRVMEVPVSVKYSNLGVTSKKPALLHGMDLISTLLKLTVKEKPLKYLGLPGVSLTFSGGVLGVYLLLMFNMTGYFNLLTAMLMMMLSFVGLLLTVSALNLNGFKRIEEKLKLSEEVNGHQA